MVIGSSKEIFGCQRTVLIKVEQRRRARNRRLGVGEKVVVSKQRRSCLKKKKRERELQKPLEFYEPRPHKQESGAAYIG